MRISKWRAVYLSFVLVPIMLWIGYTPPRSPDRKPSAYSDRKHRSQTDKHHEADTGNDAASTDLDTYLENLYEHEININRNWSVQEVDNIASAVREMVEEIIYKAFEHQDFLHIPRDRVSRHLVGFGSMAEDTKTRNPDEFDFQLNFPHFSDQNIRIVWNSVKKLTANMSYVNETRYKQTNVNDNIEDVTERHTLTSGGDKMKYVNETKHVLRSDTQPKQYESDTRFTNIHDVISNGRLTTNIKYLLQNLVKPVFQTLYKDNYRIDTDTGTLRIAENNTPVRYMCLSFSLRWQRKTHHVIESIPIRVDIVPGVYLTSRELYTDRKPQLVHLANILHVDVYNLLPPFYQDTFDIGKGGADEFNFFPAFVHTELKVMQYLQQMLPDVAKCYKIVKYYNTALIPSSYIRAVLILEAMPQVHTAKDSTSNCVLTLLNRLHKMIKGKKCSDVWFPTLLYGYDNPTQLYKCRDNKRIVNLARRFRGIINKLLQLSRSV